MRYHVMDIEAGNWTEFVLAAATDGRETRIIDSPVALWEWYSSISTDDVVMAHNGGRYDYLALIDASPRSAEWRGTMSGAGLISLAAAGKAECRDTYRVVPLALRDWTGAKTNPGIPCRCGAQCGGYCAISPRMPAKWRRRLADYCANDAIITHRALGNFIALCERWHISAIDKHGVVRRTLGAIAWATACDITGYDERPISRGEYDLARAGYYGGRCEVGRVRASSITRYDIRSAYPWALTQPVPVGEPRILDGRAATRALAQQRPGIYWADVYVPGDVPMLPMRGKNKQVIWATGYVSGAWPGLEIHGAMDYGARIIRVHSALIYPDEKPIWEPYVRRIWERRTAPTTPEWARKWLKLLANSLSGKLAQRPGMDRLIISDTPPRGNNIYPLSDRAFIARQITPPFNCARPAQAATLTARARLRVLDAIMAAPNAWIYSDTDSYYGDGTIAPSPVGDSLGDWALEGRGNDWYAVAPKVYRYAEGGRRKARAKGVPGATADIVDALGRGESARVDGVHGIRTAMSRYDAAWVARDMARHIARDRRVVGTRWIAPDGATIALRRNRDGTIYWPGIAADPCAMLGLR